MIYVIADRTDCDGIIAHALLKRGLGETKHFPADYPDFHKKLEEVINEPRGIVIIADLDLNPTIRRYTYLFERAKRKHEYLSWFDHHDGSMSQLNGFLSKYCAEITLSKDDCTSKLINEWHSRHDDDYAKWLAGIAQDYDYKNTGTDNYKLAEKIQEVIRSGFDVEKLFSMLAKDDSWQKNGELIDVLEAPRQDLIKRKKSAYKQLEDSLVYVATSPFRVMFGLSNMDLYRSDAPMYLRENDRQREKSGDKIDLYVVFFENEEGSAMIYGNNDEVETVKICNSLGGGGRGNNGGFTFGTKTTTSNYMERIKQVCHILEQYSQNKYKQK